jgi:SAM-dependent methyltransferase
MPGDETLLDDSLRAHFDGPVEPLVLAPGSDDALDRLHAVPDPWGVESRWYERRKRALALAMLPRERFGDALELGCSTGVMTEALGRRCQRVVAMDGSARAVQAARSRVHGMPHVDVCRGTIPGDLPEGPFDLVVASEVGYFLSPAGLDALADRLHELVSERGVLLLAHWRHPVAGWPLDGPKVHHRLVHAGLPPVVARYRDRDVEILLLGDPVLMPEPHR